MAGRAVLKAAQAEVNESSRRRDDILEDDLSASHDLAVWVGFGGGGVNTPALRVPWCESAVGGLDC